MTSRYLLVAMVQQPMQVSQTLANATKEAKTTVGAFIAIKVFTNLKSSSKVGIIHTF